MQKNPFPSFMPRSITPRRRSAKLRQFDAYQRLAAIYLLRLILGLNKNFKRKHLNNFFLDEAGALTGLSDDLQNNGDKADFDEHESIFKFPKIKLLRLIRNRLDTLWAEGVDAAMPLFQNISLLGESLKLNKIEQEILSLRLLMELVDPFKDKVSDHCSYCTLPAMVDYLRIMTTHPAGEIRKALQPESTLLQTGWLYIESGMVDLAFKLTLPDNLLDIMLREHTTANDLLTNFFKLASPTALTLADYAHLQPDIDVLLPYLKSAINAKQAGINILIYGPPGVGKTELAKLIAQTLDARLYEVLCTDLEGNAVRGSARFSAAAISQKIISKNRAPSLLLFDEAEDVFPSRMNFFFDIEDNGHEGKNYGDKAWINQ